MLPLKTRHDLRTALVRGIGPGYPKHAVVGVPIIHPSQDTLNVVPELRWQYQDFEGDDTPPYTRVAMTLSPTGIPDTGESNTGDSDKGRQLAEEDITDDPNDAHVRTVYGRPVHDVLNLRVTAQGNRDVPGAESDHDSLPASERAETVARTVRKFLIEQFTDEPLDAFDDEGNRIDDSGLLYGESLPTPVLARPIAGRGASNVTDQVDANGQQWDAAVALHYFDTHVEYSFSPAEGEVITTTTE